MESRNMGEKIKELEKRVNLLEDLEAIKRLQKAYGYYLEHWMYEELIDCFADNPDTILKITVGIYVGKEGVRRYFTREKERSYNPEVLHQIMQLSGIVDIVEDGHTAEGRWYGFGLVALPQGNGVIEQLFNGIYNVKYIKDSGKWKILQIIWNPIIYSLPSGGWVKQERRNTIAGAPRNPAPPADITQELDTLYPSGYIPPFHFYHPVTGKETPSNKYKK
jgi:hypothetical protein